MISPALLAAMRRLPLLLLPALAACATTARKEAKPIAVIEPVAAWEATVAPADRARIEGLDAGWSATRAGLSRRAARLVAAEGALLDPGGALDQPTPPPGPYRCRRLRLGGTRGLVATPPGFCAVIAPTVGGPAGNGFTVQTGDERPDGWLYAMSDTRLVFLGGVATGKAERAPAYGSTPASDVVGVFERIGAFRWRLALSRPRGGVDVWELVPVPPKMKGDPGAVQSPG